VIPIYLGSKNIRNYEPRKNSIIVVNEYKSLKELIKKIYEINNNQGLYNQYLEYKEKDFSDSFLALIDISSVHSYCRLCYHLYDEYNNFFEYKKKEGRGKMVYVRERNRFYFKRIKLKVSSIKELSQRILENFGKEELSWEGDRKRGKKIKIYRIYHSFISLSDGLYNNNYLINSDDLVMKLKYGSKLDVILI
jgi:hypothetical protein